MIASFKYVVARTASLGAVAFALMACGSTLPRAKLAKAGDVRGCKAIGEVKVNGDPGAGSADPRADALQEAAAAKGATDVVAEDSNDVGSELKGQMYKCHEELNSKPPSRSEQRSGF